MPVSLQVRFNDADIAMMQQNEISSMINDVKKDGADASLKYAATMHQVDLNVANVHASKSRKGSMFEDFQNKANEDPELAAMIHDIKSNGPKAAWKYAKNEELMNKLNAVFFGVDPAMVQEAENRMKEMVQGPQGGLGSVYDTDDETKPEWDRPRLLGGGEGKKFGIISCLICFCCFPCGLLAICFPCDNAE